MKSNILLFSVFLLFISCFRPAPRAKRAFVRDGFCFQNKDEGLGALLELNGYYESPSNPGNVTVFLKDGRFIDDIPVLKKNSDNRRAEYKAMKLLEGDFIMTSASWGTYHLTGDTIKAGYIYTVQPPWLKEEKWYRIIDIHTIEVIACTSLYPGGCGGSVGQRSVFVKCDSIPDFYNSWIIKKKWFWCDKEAYEKWKAGQQK